jgi:hypothetical protein
VHMQAAHSALQAHAQTHCLTLPCAHTLPEHNSSTYSPIKDAQLQSCTTANQRSGAQRNSCCSSRKTTHTDKQQQLYCTARRQCTMATVCGMLTAAAGAADVLAGGQLRQSLQHSPC